MTTKVLI